MFVNICTYSYNIRANNCLHLKKVPSVRIEARKRSLTQYNPWSCRDLKDGLNLDSLISLMRFMQKFTEVFTTNCSRYTAQKNVLMIVFLYVLQTICVFATCEQ